MNVTPIGMYSDRRNKCINEGAIIICYQTLHDINWLYNYLLLVTFVLESGTRLTVSDAVQIIMRFIWFDKFKICMRYQSLCPHSIRLFMWFLYATWEFMPAFHSYIGHFYVMNIPSEFVSFIGEMQWFRNDSGSSGPQACWLTKIVKEWKNLVKDVDSTLQFYWATEIYYKHIAGVRMGAA